MQVLSRQELLFRPLVLVSGESSSTQFTFDHVLPEAGTQDEVFMLHGPVMTRKALDGINCTL